MSQSTSVVMIDGVKYKVVLPTGGLKRSFSILDGENSGRVQTGRMERDIIGTYYNYTIEIQPDMNKPEDYDKLYEVISSPVASHQIIVPYGQTLYQFEAYITDAEDSLLLSDYFGRNIWSGLTLNFVAMEPRRTPETNNQDII